MLKKAINRRNPRELLTATQNGKALFSKVRVAIADVSAGDSFENHC